MPARPLHKSWSLWPFPPVEMFIGRHDVVHGTNFVVPPAWRAATIITVHDLTPVHFPELVEPGSLAYASLVRAALRRGSWVHTPTQFVADEVVEVFGADPARVRAVHLGVPALARPPGPPGNPGPPGPTRPPVLPAWVTAYVLAVGTVEPRKDYPSLVSAFGKIAGDRPGLALVIAGGERWGRQQLDEAVAACPAGDRVVRLGWVDDAQRDDLIAGASVLAFPSRYEGFGFPPLQAMAAGIPVVATRIGALEEVLGDAACLVPLGDSEALADALAHLLDDEGARQELAARGRQRASRYTWQACAEGLEALYRAAVAVR